MKGLENLFVSFELAKQLKEKGFDEPCFGMYFHEDGLLYIKEANKAFDDFLAPTHQQVTGWLRKEKGIQLFIDYVYYDGLHYGFKFITPSGGYVEDWKDNDDEPKGWDTYDEALNKGIETILKLI